MKSILTAILFASIFTACKNEPVVPAKEHKTVETDSLKKVSPQQKLSDTLVVDKRCAVDYWASQEKMDKMEKEGGDGFYTAADDVGWYVSESITYLDSIKFPRVSTKGYRYVCFKKAEGAPVYIDTDTIQGIANIYLFDPSKNPVNADITYMQEAFKEYFEVE